MRTENLIHPGEILREEFMVPMGISQNRLAIELRIPATRIGEIVNERRGISTDTAVRLGIFFGTGPEFWTTQQRGVFHDSSLRSCNLKNGLKES